MDQFVNSLRNLGATRLAILAGTAAATIAFIVFLVTRVNAPGMALLYGDLELEDSGRLVSRLESMGVPYQLRAEGSQIFVPADRALQLRMTLAQEGLPNTGSVGYEVFDKSGSLGASSFVNDINRVRALEGELSRTIKTIASVRAARVHLVLPRRELFSREKQEPSASIALRLRNGDQLTPSQVRAIQSLVAAAVPGLTPSRVSVVDHNGNLLARSVDDAKEGGSLAGRSDELRRAYEQRVSRSIEELVGRAVGHGKVRFHSRMAGGQHQKHVGAFRLVEFLIGPGVDRARLLDVVGRRHQPLDVFSLIGGRLLTRPFLRLIKGFDLSS